MENEFKEPTVKEWDLETKNLSRICDVITEIKDNHQSEYFKGFYGAIHIVIVAMVAIYSLADNLDKGIVSIALNNIAEMGKEYTHALKRSITSKLN